MGVNGSRPATPPSLGSAESGTTGGGKTPVDCVKTYRANGNEGGPSSRTVYRVELVSPGFGLMTSHPLVTWSSMIWAFDVGVLVSVTPTLANAVMICGTRFPATKSGLRLSLSE